MVQVFCFVFRLALAALHFNENSGRNQALTKDGQPQFRISFPKSRRGEAIAKEIKTCQTFGKFSNRNYHIACLSTFTETGPASVAQLDASSDWRLGGRGFNPRRGRQHSFVEIDHIIFSTVILSLPLIQEEQLSVSGERMCTILVNRLED